MTTDPRPRIITVNARPPIPTRRFDWVAFRDGEEERGRYGYGATEREALADLASVEEEDEG